MRVRNLVLIILFSCAGEPQTDNADLRAADDTNLKPNSKMAPRVTLGASLQTIENANLRDEPNAQALVLRIVPAGARLTVLGSDTALANDWYYVRHDGLVGFMAGAHLKFLSAPDNLVVDDAETTPDAPPVVMSEEPAPTGPVTSDPPPVVPPPQDPLQSAIDRAATGVGFSYWWGGSKWDPSGATSSNKGSCSGTCGGDPPCTHTGPWGADCSGYVAKAWQIPASNTDITKANHAYSTVNFANQTTEWTFVTSAEAKKADAFVYNTNGRGHIFLFESRDPWNKVWAYEAKGCAAGIVHNLRSVDDIYKTIRRNGY